MIFIYFIDIYFLIGLVCAVVFFAIGYKWVLTDAVDVTWLVRLLWVPAAVAIWPILVFKWAFKWLNQDSKAARKGG